MISSCIFSLNNHTCVLEKLIFFKRKNLELIKKRNIAN